MAEILYLRGDPKTDVLTYELFDDCQVFYRNGRYLAAQLDVPFEHAKKQAEKYL